jgi:penicillin-binding protein 1A
VLDPSLVPVVNRILSEVVAMGTGTAANIGRPQAGKTGTATDYKNAWFVGYTPELSTAVWVGYRDANKPLIGVEGVPKMAGGTIPARIWGAYMKAALPQPDKDTLVSDATDLGLINAPPASAVTSTVVGTETVTSSVLPSGAPAACALLPSTTAVAPKPSPSVTGTTYNEYPFLVCGAGPGPSTSDTASPAPTDSSSPPPGPGLPVYPTGSPFPTPSPSPRPNCLLFLLCG